MFTVIRPSHGVVFVLAALVSVTGCIFPFTRNHETKLQELVANSGEASPDAAVAAQMPVEPPPVAVAEVPLAAAETPQTEKSPRRLPPFVRFLGGMFGGGNSQPEPPSTDPAVPEPAPENAVAVPEVTNPMADKNLPQILPPAKSPEPAGPRDTVVTTPGSLQSATLSAATASTPSTTTTNAPSPKPSAASPVVVANPHTSPGQTGDVVSKFAAKAEKSIAAQCNSADLPKITAPQSSTTGKESAETNLPNVPKPTASDFDRYARSPWEGLENLAIAKKNSSTQSQTLRHSLELTLHRFEAERTGKPYVAPVDTSVASTEPSMPRSRYGQAAPAAIENQPTAQTTPRSEPMPSVETETMTAATSVPPANSLRAASGENPLRTPGGRTDWSGTHRPSAAPETIVNSTTAPSYPKTQFPTSRWNETPDASQAMAAPETQPGPAVSQAPQAEPAITMNPYAKQDGPAKSAAAEPETVASLDPPAKAKPTASTEEIHFQSSLLSKLQAANNQADWDFNELEAPSQNEATTAPQTTIIIPPQTIEKPASVPQITQPGTIVNDTQSSSPEPLAVSEPRPAETSQKAIQPLVISEPPQRIQIHKAVRPGASEKLLFSSDAVSVSDSSSSLPPVVRIDDLPASLHSSQKRSGTKVYVIRGTEP